MLLCRYQKFPSKENSGVAANHGDSGQTIPVKPVAASLAVRQAAVLLAQQQQQRQDAQRASTSSSLDSLHSSGTQTLLSMSL